ncbi:MAG: sulfite exporter TauE/SafE family protein, partial [Hymenobacteraceae bacterium]|nr:sulfite exporter TauE/SafE family protein [Hymenobacteraceae bacterium]MDX5397777.1 sulfite exporter TauE/SafE family protein [Hymenobacteraceae bacterium]MDX5513854.1 sulfite exporter TauE/SafE family protein [Hymenobacteraceae bacterium]
DVLIFVIGMLVSAFGTVVGFGGSVFMVPILIIFFDFPMPIAIGSSMAALLPASLISSFFNYREKNIDYLVGSLIQLPAVAGTILGSFLVAFLPVLELQFTFAFFVIVVGALMLLPRKNKGTDARKQGMMYRIRRMPTSFIRKNRPQNLAYRLNGGIIALFGTFSGVIAGLFGIGGGFLQTPVMIRLFKMPPHIATSTSLFILVITSLTGFITHYMLNHILLYKSVALVLGFSVGALGGRLYKKQKKVKLKLDYLIGFGLLLAGLGVIVNVVLRSGLLKV